MNNNMIRLGITGEDLDCKYGSVHSSLPILSFTPGKRRKGRTEKGEEGRKAGKTRFYNSSKSVSRSAHSTIPF